MEVGAASAKFALTKLLKIFTHTWVSGMCFLCGSACTFQKTCSDHIGGIYIQSVLDLTFSDRSVDGCACFFPEDFRNMDLVLQG